MIDSGFLATPNFLYGRGHGPFHGDGVLRDVYLTLCHWANFRDGTTAAGPVLRGQLVTSQDELSRETGYGRQVIRRCLTTLTKLKKINQATNQATNQAGTTITVCDYDTLFGNAETTQPGTQPGTQPATNHIRTRTQETEQERTSCNGDGKPSPRELTALWNEMRKGGMRQVRECEPGTRRWNAAKARLSERSLEEWRPIIARVSASRFCRGEQAGRDGSKPWAANFDWLLRPDTRTKIEEGTYDDSGGVTASKPATNILNFTKDAK